MMLASNLTWKRNSVRKSGLFVVLQCLAVLLVGLGCHDPARPTSSSPIVVTDDGSTVWVVNPDSDTVGKIDTAGSALIREIRVGDNPRTLALTRDEALKVSNK